MFDLHVHSAPCVFPRLTENVGPAVVATALELLVERLISAGLDEAAARTMAFETPERLVVP